MGVRKRNRQIQTIGNMINKHLMAKGAVLAFVCISQRIRNEHFCIDGITGTVAI